MDSGSAYVVFGRNRTATIDLASLGTSGFRIDGAGAGNSAGTSVAGVGDVNGDGMADVIVGAPGGRYFGSGSAYVIFGRSATTSVDLAALGAGGFRIKGGTFQFQGVTLGTSGLGISVGGAGDV